MQGVMTHVSVPKSNTACTTAFNNIPDTHRLAPSQPSILVSCAQFFLAFFKFIITVGQFPSPYIKTRPKYLNKVNISSGLM